jgi:flagellar biogenesis protein FliO
MESNMKKIVLPLLALMIAVTLFIIFTAWLLQETVNSLGAK